MITSILDNDLYKFSMQNAVIKLFPHAKVRYSFINRAKTPFPEGFAEELRNAVYKMQHLILTPEEKDFLLQKCPFLEPAYIDFLDSYRYNPGEVGIIQRNGDLQISIEGHWYRTILWEVPLMALVSELYFKMTHQKPYPVNQITEIVRNKAARFNMKAAKVSEFGTRRRFSFEVQDMVINELVNYGKPSLNGTSNLHFAMKYKLAPIGTQAHEWFMFHAAKYGFKMANELALENWTKVYNGELGIALSDTFTTEVFFRAFDSKYARLFDGVRHDSGDPLAFADKTIKHYEQLGIDPKSKMIVFSDALTPDKVIQIADYCRNRINFSFGIGTNFTNDVGVTPLNIVIKMVEAKPLGQNWQSTIKLSDETGKYTGDGNAIKQCKDNLGIE